MHSHYHQPRIPCIRYSSITDKVVTNTTNETSMIGAGTGKLNIVYPIPVGTVIRVYLTEYVSTANPPGPSTIALKLDGATLVSSIGTLPSSLDQCFFETLFTATVRASGVNGSVMTQGRSMVSTTHGVSTSYVRDMLALSPVAVNLTNFPAIDVTYKWDTASASNSVTVTNFYVEINAPDRE